MLGYLVAGAAQGFGQGTVNDARSRHAMMLQELRESRADARLERGAALESEARREAAKLNSQTEVAREERGARQADFAALRSRQTQAKTPVVDAETRAETTLDIFKALDPGRDRNDLAGLLGGDVSDMPDTSNMTVEERWAMSEQLTERLYPSRQRATRSQNDAPSKNDILDDAIDALAEGKPRDQVEAVLRANGIDPSRLPTATAGATDALPEAAPAPASASSQADRYGGEMAGQPRSREPVRGRREDSWNMEPVQGEPADILGGAARAVGGAARAVGDALRPNPEGILTEEGQERQREEDAPSRAQREMESLTFQLQQIERDLVRLDAMERDGTATPEEVARARRRKERQREMIEEQMMAADPERPR